MARPRKPTLVLPSYVHRVVSRGKEYFTYQRGKGTKHAGPRIKLPHPSDPDFIAAVCRAAGEPPPQPKPGTFEVLIKEYRASPEWRQLSDASRRDYGRYLDGIERTLRRFRVDALEPKHVLALRDARQDTPAAANNLVRVLSALISWSVPRGFRNDNPCEHIRKFKIGEWPRWSWEAICHWRENAVPEMWCAAALALYTGQRQSDVLGMGWTSVELRQHRSHSREDAQKSLDTDPPRFEIRSRQNAEKVSQDPYKSERGALDKRWVQISVGSSNGMHRTRERYLPRHGVSRVAKVGRLHAPRSWLFRCHGFGDHRPVTRHGRTLLTRDQPTAAGGDCYPCMGERKLNRICTTFGFRLHNAPGRKRYPFEMIGEPGRDRTDDPLIKSQMLYR